MFIEDEVEKQGPKFIQVNLLNHWILTVNILGETFFSRFYQDVRILDLAYKVIIDNGFDREEDEAKDDIEMR